VVTGPESSAPRRVVLVSTAAIGERGSMRAYAELVQTALARHAPAVQLELLELSPAQARGRWSRRWAFAGQHVRARRARRRAPDLWHVLDGSRAHVAGAFGGEPVVITLHDVIPWLQDRGECAGVPPLGTAARLLWRANGRALRKAAALACVSASSARDAQRVFAVPAAHCHLAPLALRESLARLANEADAWPREPVVLHVGGDGFYKNREGVLQVFSRMSHPDARLVMAGAPPSEAQLRLVEALGISGRVQWLPDADDETLARLYGSATALLFPSRYEGFGWPVLEAMAFGAPVVASSAGSLPEVLGGGVEQFAPEDHAGMARALDRLFADPAEAQRQSAQGRVRAAAFNERAFAQNILAAYAAACQRGAGA
jgi:glycosyltransferase involved in cell wall biosynthesis